MTGLNPVMTMSPSSRTLRALYVLGVTASIALAPETSDAQLGGLIKKKAVDAAKGRAQAKVPQAQPAEDLSKLGSPFTSATLDRVLNSLEINARAWAKSDTLAKRLEPFEKQLADLNATKSDEINAFEAKHSEWNECRRDASRAYTEAHADQNDAIAKKMEAMAKADPAAAQRWGMEFARMGQQMNAALTKGDSVGALEIQRAFYKKHGLESALGITEEELLKKCGSEPAPPASYLQRKKLEARLDTMRTQKRDAEFAAQERARNASGMSAEDFHPLNERLERWYAIAVKGEKSARFWSDDEGALLESRKARIVRIFELRKV